MLAEATTTEISKEREPKTFEENRHIENQGGQIAVILGKKLKFRQVKV